MQSGAIWTLKFGKHQDFIVDNKVRKTWWPFPTYQFTVNCQFVLATVLYMVWESFNWYRIFQSDFACHLMLKQTEIQCLPCSWRIMQWFNLSLRLHSCSKIPVLSLLRAEAERSFTAFVSGTTGSIKLHKVWEIINSWTGGVSKICH